MSTVQKVNMISILWNNTTWAQQTIQLAGKWA